MAWEVYDGAGPRVTHSPKLTVRADGVLYVNATADREWFADADLVSVLVDMADSRIAVAGDDRGGQTFTLSRTHDHGFEFGTGGVVTDLGIDVDALGEAEQVSLAWDEDVEAAVADLSSLVDEGEQVGRAGADARSEAETDESVGSETADADDADAGDTPCEGSAADAGGAEVEDGQDADQHVGRNGDDPRELVEAWVRQKVGTGHEYLLESREIAEHLPLSGPQVGQHLRFLAEDLEDVSVEHVPKDASEAFDRGKWRLGAVEMDGADEGEATEPRFGPDRHEPTEDTEPPSDETIRDLARAETTVVGLAGAHPALTPLSAKRLNRDLDLGLEDNVEGRDVGARWNGGAES